MTKLKKIIYYGVTALSIGILILSIVYNTKPEYLRWLPEILGLSPEATQAMLTTLGFGGSIGTSGFLLIHKLLNDGNNNLENISKDMLTKTKLSVLDLQNKYDNVVKSLETFKNENALLKNTLNINTAVINKLSNRIIELINLENINLNKTLLNPLVSEETKNMIKEALENGEDKETTELSKAGEDL